MRIHAHVGDQRAELVRLASDAGDVFYALDEAQYDRDDAESLSEALRDVDRGIRDMDEVRDMLRPVVL